jgi:tetratricopeptide (TPR) repeat protein
LDNSQPNWFSANFHLARGQAYNNAFLHEEAINELTRSIEFELENSEAYIERAFANFELQQFELAMEDYKKRKISNITTELS